MKKKHLLAGFAVSGLLMMTNSFALTETTESTDKNTGVANTEQMLQNMSAQAGALEVQMKMLKKQIRDLKAEQQTLKQQKTQTTVVSVHQASSADEVKTVQSSASPELPPVKFIAGTPIAISPYLGDHNSFSPYDLIVTYSSYNEDLALLQMRQIIDAEYQKDNMTLPSPMLMISGKVEGSVFYQKPYAGSHTSQASLASSELDLIPMINQWANGLITFKYDDSKVQNTPLASNSRVYVDRAFLTFGNLNVFPLYASLGQMNVPFGTYSSNMITSPLTDSLFQTKARALLVGYQAADGQGLYAEAYGFNGDASTHHTGNINDLGANVGWDAKQTNWNFDAGVGAIANVADSMGMQETGASEGFAGYSEPTLTNASPEILQRQVPGIATHLNFGVGSFGLYSEYITATSDFASQDMTFDNGPAKPHAVNVETFYNFPIYGKPSAITIGYSGSWDALALNVPEHRYIASLSTSVWKDTIEQLEFRHDINYGTDSSASAAGVVVPDSAKGGSSNTVTLQLGIYF